MRDASSRARHVLHLLAGGLVLAGSYSPSASADCSSEPYIASVCDTGASFCPRGYAEANGAVLSISSNQALFALIGCTYGGDCRSTFALPNLQSRSAIHVGQGNGLSPITPGQASGAESVTLTANQLAAHNHAATTTVTLKGRSTDEADSSDPNGHILGDPAVSQTGDRDIYSTLAANAALATTAATATTQVGNAGGSSAVGIRNPYLGMRYCIATTGVFPPRD